MSHEATLKDIATKQAAVRLARVKAIDQGVGLLSEEQRQRLLDTSRAMGRMMGAFVPTPPDTRQ